MYKLLWAILIGCLLAFSPCVTDVYSQIAKEEQGEGSKPSAQAGTSNNGPSSPADTSGSKVTETGKPEASPAPPPPSSIKTGTPETTKGVQAQPGTIPPQPPATTATPPAQIITTPRPVPQTTITPSRPAPPVPAPTTPAKVTQPTVPAAKLPPHVKTIVPPAGKTAQPQTSTPAQSVPAAKTTPPAKTTTTDTGSNVPTQTLAPSLPAPSSGPKAQGQVPVAPSTVQPVTPPATTLQPGQPAVSIPSPPPPVPAQALPAPVVRPPVPTADPTRRPPNGQQPAPAPGQPILAPATPNGQRPPAQPSSPVQPRLPQPGGRAAAPQRGGMISLNFDDADIYSVVQTVFGDILRVNYIIDQRVKGRVTFRSVAPVPSNQVLPLMEVILRLNSVGIVEESGLYRIVPIAEVPREPAPVSIGRDPNTITLQGKALIHIVPVTFLQAGEVLKLLNPFLSANAVAIEVPNANQIILVDTDANIKRLLQLVSLFDNEQVKKKKPQVFVHHVQNSKAKDVASILQQVFLGTGGTGSTGSTPTLSSSSASGGASGTSGQSSRPPSAAPAPAAPARPGGAAGGASSSSSSGDTLVSPTTKIFADEILNSIIILSTPEDYELIGEAIEQLDIMPRQVIIEGLIAEVNLKDDLSLGISWALQLNPGGMGGALGAVAGTVGFNTPGATPGADTGKGTFTFAGVVGQDFKTVINMLATQSKAKLLATPHILVSDNREARIQVGEQVPIVTSETFGSGTVAPQRTIQYKDIGIILKVKPRINEGGLVALDLTQEVSSYDTIKLFADETNIILKKIEASTNLVVQDGETIVIGGLIREDKSDSMGGIPVLSKLPLLGYFFGSTDLTNRRSELIILLTPRVIRNQNDATKVTSGYIRSITESGKGKLRKEDLLQKGGPQPQGTTTIIVPRGPATLNGEPGKVPQSPPAVVVPTR